MVTLVRNGLSSCCGGIDLYTENSSKTLRFFVGVCRIGSERCSRFAGLFLRNDVLV